MLGHLTKGLYSELSWFVAPIVVFSASRSELVAPAAVCLGCHSCGSVVRLEMAGKVEVERQR
jgi:hypothetical protein